MKNILIITSFISIFGSCIAAFTGSYFGLKKFKKEKYWDEKLKAYNLLINAIEKIRFISEVQRADSFFEPTIGFSKDYDIHEPFNEGMREVIRYSATGLLISREFRDHVKVFEKKVFNIQFSFNEEWPGTIEEDKYFFLANRASEIFKAADEILPSLIKIAKRDLGQLV